MSGSTDPCFVVGSGRCGTRALARMLGGVDGVQAHHEYLCHHVQQLAALFAMGRLDHDRARQRLEQLHGAAVHYSEARLWVDCSNKLAWLVGPLHALFPRARFVHLVRDGRNVVSSFFHKLPAEMYDDEAVATLQAWLEDGTRQPRPPPEKRYWWKLPRPGEQLADEFGAFDRFERVCYHWVESNRVLLDSLGEVPPEQRIVVALEELVASRSELRRLLAFLDVPYGEELFDGLQRPVNVFFPMDFGLTSVQAASFERIAGPMMRTLGYDERPAYRVQY